MMGNTLFKTLESIPEIVSLDFSKFLGVKQEGDIV